MAGRLEKEKKRKQRTESRLAQRTGKSTLDRQIERLIKAIKEGKIKPAPMPSYKAPDMKEWFQKKLDRLEKSKKEDERLRLLGKAGGNAKGGKLKHGGKAKKMKAYSKGGKAK
jgi:hypothetical protein